MGLRVHVCPLYMQFHGLTWPCFQQAVSSFLTMQYSICRHVWHDGCVFFVGFVFFQWLLFHPAAKMSNINLGLYECVCMSIPQDGLFDFLDNLQCTNVLLWRLRTRMILVSSSFEENQFPPISKLYIYNTRNR